MARGWESKSVEANIDRTIKGDPGRKYLSKEETERLREIESLRLSRSRLTRDLEAASHPRYREMLEKALAEIDGRMEKVLAERVV